MLQKEKNEKSFKKSKLYVFATTVLWPLVLMVILISAGLLFGWKYTYSHTEEQQQTEAERLVSKMEQEIQSQFTALEGYSAGIAEDDLKDVKSILDKLNTGAERTDFNHLCFAFPNGELWREDSKIANVKERDYFIHSLQGESYCQFVHSEFMNDYAVVYSVPVIFDGEVKGVLAGIFAVEDFRNKYEALFGENVSCSYLVNSDGEVLIATESANHQFSEMELLIDNANYNETLSDVEFYSGSALEMSNALRNGIKSNAIYSLDGERRYTTVLPVSNSGWSVLNVFCESLVYQELTESFNMLYVVALSIMAAVLAVVLSLLIRSYRLAGKEKKRAEENSYLLKHDSLTGLFSERAFRNQVKERLVNAKPGEYCIVGLDIYRFSLINKLIGSSKADELLCLIAKRLEELTDKYDGISARAAADKFLAFLPYKEDIIQQLELARDAVVNNDLHEVFIYYGIYVIEDTSVEINEMIAGAQLAQKKIKGDVNVFVAYYDEELKNKTANEQKIISAMVGALENEEFIIYLQPQFNYKTGKISSAEALVRWKSPTEGLISPGEFIPIFESNGFIRKLDEFVWETVCKLQRKWLDEGKDVLPISVNVSRRDLQEGRITEKFLELIEKYELSSDLIQIEITESAYVENAQDLIREIIKLKDNGFVVEIDDFGTGYSSLNMLKDIPAKVIKTDLLFLTETGDEQRKECILNGVIDMAYKMGMSIIAEGVETKEQADYLLRMNCENMQGYYFSRPISVEDYEKLVY